LNEDDEALEETKRSWMTKELLIAILARIIEETEYEQGTIKEIEG